ncbi:MAG: efflux RND transporter permease subunit [Verrucomicrobia bacterium]|jgi:multidrug efflux pump|nr:efflux RND transporter permease subunit [Verrucomicrobiota bacterium]
MKLPEISIQRPVLATMMSLALVLFGAISLSRLPVRELPDIDPPIVNVTTVYPGANASVVETEITERLEEAVNNVPGIKTLTSESREQVSNITIEFNLTRDIDVAAQDVRDRVSRVRGRLPETIDEPVISKQDSDARPIIWIGMSSDRFTPLELTDLAEKQIKNRLQTVEGVSSITIGGEQRFAIRLWLDSEKMAAHQVTVLDVQQALREQNVELPSGRVENWDREMTIQTRGEMKSVEDFNQLVVRQDQDRFVRLRDIGRAEQGVENERTGARNNGRPCIFLGIVKQSKANSVAVSHGIRDQLELVRPTIPDGIEMVVNYDESTFVEESISEVWLTLGFAFFLVVMVIFVFLHNLRATLIPAIAIPVSIIASFAIMHLLGYSINILTMLALVLAIGIVVDDAIVVLENIHRHIEEGMQPMDAAFKGMKEITFAVIATTVALVAVFAPLAFQSSTTGRLFVEFAAALVASVIVSTFVALSLTPMMAARILKPTGKKQGFLVRRFEATLHLITRLYKSTLQSLLDLSVMARLGILGMLAVLLFFASQLLYTHLEGDFLPEEDKGRLFCFVIAPEGSTSEYTDRMLKQMEQILSETPEIEIYGSLVAPGFSGPGLANNGIVFVHLKEDRDRSVQEIVNSPGGIRQRFFTEVEGAIAIPTIPKTINRSFGSPFQVVIQAGNLEELDAFATGFVNQLRQSGFMQNVQSSFEVNKPELKLDIDRNRAAALGVSIQDISRTLQILFGGLDISRIKQDGKEYDVIAQLQRTSRLTPGDLDKIYVRNRDGGLVQLSSIVRREVGVAPNKIERYNRIRSATISGTPVGVTMGTAVEKVKTMLDEQLPPGFLYDWSGESRDLQDAGKEIYWVLILALIIVYMVLASQFESLVHPLTVMLTVPLAVVGALGLLWLLGALGKMGLISPIPAMNINLFSQIGMVLLVGLVTKNGILLVEFANQLKEQGLNAHQAMAQSGAVRLRPILMTAVSTVSGILPIAIGFGAGAESRRPMGVVIVGGMLTSTFLTLFVIPLVYTVFSDVAAKIRKNPQAIQA